MRSVVVEEMLHMGLMCDLLAALVEVPWIVDGYRNDIRYPGGLPRGVHPGLTVYLAGSTRDHAKNAYLEIEKPEDLMVAA